MTWQPGRMRSSLHQGCSMGLRSLTATAKLLALFHLYFAVSLAKQPGADHNINKHGGVSRTDQRKQQLSPVNTQQQVKLFASAKHDNIVDNASTKETASLFAPWNILNGLSNRNSPQEMEARHRDKRDINNVNDNESSTQTGSVAAKYKLFVKLAATKPFQGDKRLQAAMASLLRLSPSNVHLQHLKAPSGETLEVLVSKKSQNSVQDSSEGLMLAQDVKDTISKEKLQQVIPDLKVSDVYTQRELRMDFAQRAPDDTSGETSIHTFVPYIAAGGALLALCLIVVSVWCYMRNRSSKNKSEYDYPSNRSSPSPPAHLPPQRVYLYPQSTPTIHPTATLIQPDVTQIITNKACGECGTPVHTPPLRMKKGGLLERRGSNASLTLDLGHSNHSSPKAKSDQPAWGSPPKESSAEEYLLSAGHRMSRKELRHCLKNITVLHEEFWEIPMNHPDRVEVAGSGTKNRYRTIIPNEHCRVKLEEVNDDPLSTYINANYIRGFAGEPKAYIATQGPMSHTVIDFWRMIWQEKTPIIVMITKLKEKNKTKCESYLPLERGIYGDIEVLVGPTLERDHYLLRQLTLKHNQMEHHVLHYWYTSWQDQRAPNKACHLLDLVKEVEHRRHLPNSTITIGPVVVHCSAGIGRTGCFIATSIGMLQLAEEHMVDVLGIICGMRLDRGGMVQTNEQYEFVHQALCLYEKELPERPPSGE